MLAGALALAACSQQAPQDPPTTIEPTVVTDKTAPPAPEIPATWPLTGVAGEPEARPAVAVKIENSPQARPQTGLEGADVVWEELVEGGITRFNAVYHSTIPDTVGPIRSVRPMDAGIAGPLHGLIVFSGGQPQFVQQMRDAGLQVISHDEGAAGMYRTGDRVAPHNVYGTMGDFLAQADAERTSPPPAQFTFALRPELATAVRSGSPASTIVTAFPSSRPSWAWSADAGRWLRSEGDSAAVSAAGEQLSAANVVVLRVQVQDTGTLDPGGNPVPETVMTGQGEGLVAAGGQTVAVTWSKEDTASPLRLTDADGNDVQLVPGNTWVELVPVSGGSVEVS
ncbi:conserved hypothetical protein [Beutenbergia cavernae DSM 12333]|uniref:Secreted protein n=1 Tax=Beutenbergia cavernae (strain ATCC BAA-8 / DSM 12333 / CCUG 43141 / JCM 11478 / NBRC 16432 / NCIMB 13614 / HKI 0122) TaxID=471853 RepID=C5C180_BEUC1|nr:conserved hypothetical protein [Beutenbergia cavernae DSM 12333]